MSETVQDRTIVTMTDLRAFDWYQNHRPWMTLNLLEWLCCRKDASFGAHCTKLNKDKPILSGTKV